MGINEKEIAEILYAINKKAKNQRDEKHDMNIRKDSRKTSKTKRNYLSNEIKEIENKQENYYQQKERILTTYFKPYCIHRQTTKKSTYNYYSNLKGVDVSKFVGTRMYIKNFYLNFLEKTYQKKMKTININGMIYKTNCFVFNDLINDDEVIENICQDIKDEYDEILVKGNKIYMPMGKEYDLTDIFERYLITSENKIPESAIQCITKNSIRIYKEEISSHMEEEYFLLYKVDKYSFHVPITKEQLKNYNHLDIYNVTLNTKGTNEKHLLDDKAIKKTINNLI